LANFEIPATARIPATTALSATRAGPIRTGRSK
jgi:hypothetical protein